MRPSRGGGVARCASARRRQAPRAHRAPRRAGCERRADRLGHRAQVERGDRLADSLEGAADRRPSISSATSRTRPEQARARRRGRAVTRRRDRGRVDRGRSRRAELVDEAGRSRPRTRRARRPGCRGRSRAAARGGLRMSSASCRTGATRALVHGVPSGVEPRPQAREVGVDERRLAEGHAAARARRRRRGPLSANARSDRATTRTAAGSSGSRSADNRGEIGVPPRLQARARPPQPRRRRASRRRAPPSRRARASALRRSSAPRRDARAWRRPAPGRSSSAIGVSRSSPGTRPVANETASATGRSARSVRDAREARGKPCQVRRLRAPDPALSIAPATVSASPPPSRSSVETAPASGATSSWGSGKPAVSPPACAVVVLTAVPITPRSTPASRSPILPSPPSSMPGLSGSMSPTLLSSVPTVPVRLNPSFRERAAERVEQSHQPARTWIQVRKMPPGANAFDSTSSPALPEIGFPSRSKR